MLVQTWRRSRIGTPHSIRSPLSMDPKQAVDQFPIFLFVAISAYETTCQRRKNSYGSGQEIRCCRRWNLEGIGFVGHWETTDRWWGPVPLCLCNYRGDPWRKCIVIHQQCGHLLVFNFKQTEMITNFKLFCEKPSFVFLLS